MHATTLLSTTALILAGVLGPQAAGARSIVDSSALGAPASMTASTTTSRATAGTCSPTVLVDNGVPSLVTASQAATMQAVLQQYASQDVAPIWPDCDTITLSLVDYPDPYSGTMGWHNYFNSKVVAFFDVMDGGLDYRLASHEIAESIADPRPMTYVPATYSGPCDTCAGAYYQGAVRFEREIADPVENLTRGVVGPDGQTYQLSDFVLPSFFQPDAAGPFDWAGLVHRPQAPTVDLHFVDAAGHARTVAGPQSNGEIGD